MRKELLHTQDSVERVTGAPKLQPTSHSRNQIRNEIRIFNRKRTSRKICVKSAKSQQLPSAFQTNPETSGRLRQAPGAAGSALSFPSLS